MPYNSGSRVTAAQDAQTKSAPCALSLSGNHLARPSRHPASLSSLLSKSRRALKALKKAADEDLFADLKEKFEKVEAELKDDTRTNLETYREQVIETINNDIVMRHGYQAGVIEHSLPEDTEVQRAIGILNNPQEYKRITTEQDTARK